MVMKQQELSVLSNVIAVARRELADRDAEEIPNRMVRVAKSGGKRIAPPFQASVVKELVANESFRESVLERWESEDVDDPVGLAFLTDPDSGIETVTKEAAKRNRGTLKADLDRASQTIRSLEGQIAESKTRFADAAEHHGAELDSRDVAAAASRSSLERAVRVLTERIAELERDEKNHTAELAELTTNMEDLSVKYSRLMTRERKKAQRDHVRVHRTMSPPSDPVEFAAWLDAVEKKQRSFRQANEADAIAASDDPQLRIPWGLLPDSHEALSALIGQRPDVIYIDGYNVAGTIAEDFSSSKTRSRVAAISDRLASASQSRVVVVFDAMGAEGRRRMPSFGRAELRFSQHQIADDEIVELVHGNPSRSVVITSDRELNIRCADEGCVTVWSEALVQWASR